MDSDLTALDAAVVDERSHRLPAVVGDATRLGVVFGSTSRDVTSWFAARTAAAELVARLDPCTARLVCVGPQPSSLGWVAADDVEVVDADLPVEDWDDLLQQFDVVLWLQSVSDLVPGLAESVGAHAALPWQRGPSSAGRIDVDGLVALAPGVVSRAVVAASNPLRTATGQVVVALGPSDELGATLTGEIVRLAASMGLTLQMVRHGADEGAVALTEMLASLSEAGCSEVTTHDMLSPEQFLGAIHGARVVVTVDEQLAALARPFNPRVAYVPSSIDSDVEAQRLLRASTDAVRDLVETVALERALDNLAGVLDAALGSRPGRADDRDVERRWLRRRLERAGSAHTALARRLLSERDRSSGVVGELQGRLAEAEEARREAQAAAATAEAMRTRSVEHVNELEMRLADLDQGRVAVPERSLQRRILMRIDRGVVGVARRVRNRILGA